MSGPALAIPSFATQTGMACAQCHTLAFGPALTAYGRAFKLNGYVWGQAETHVPIALMLQGGYSRSAAAQPNAPFVGFSANDNVSLDQVSLFAGTRVSEHLGVFAQGTWSGAQRTAHWDNTDVRYARQLSLLGRDAVVGVSINNNPTVQDLWNSTPAWGYPYISSPLVPAPSANPIITGALAQTVLGSTVYAMVHDHYYLEAGGYRGLPNHWLANLGMAGGGSNLRGVVPYWRAAYQRTMGDAHYFSLGTFGLRAEEQPAAPTPLQDRFTDVALDATYQYAAGPNGLLMNVSWTHEKQARAASVALGSAAQASNHLNAIRLDASYVYRQTLSLGAGWFDVRGGADATLYARAPLTGSDSGSPDSSGYILQVEAVPFGKLSSWGSPWVNLRTGVQYTGYLRFNGGSSNYDGSGRAASQNNSLAVFAWILL